MFNMTQMETENKITISHTAFRYSFFFIRYKILLTGYVTNRSSIELQIAKIILILSKIIVLGSGTLKPCESVDPSVGHYGTVLEVIFICL